MKILMILLLIATMAGCCVPVSEYRDICVRVSVESHNDYQEE